MAGSEFQDLLKQLVHERRFVRLQYFTAQHEFIREDTLIPFADEQSIRLTDGEVVPLDRIFSVNGCRSPRFEKEEDFSCDC